MEESENKFGEVLVDGIKKISNIVSEEHIKIFSENQKVEFQKAIEDTKKQAEKIAVEQAKKEIDILKRDIFTMFGIFASFIAFIVGEINILKTIDSIFDKLGFSFVFVALMLGFLFAVMFLNKEEENNNKFKKMKNMFFTFFFIGIFFILIGKIDFVINLIKII